MRALWALLLVACGATSSMRSRTKRVLNVYGDGSGHYIAMSLTSRQLYFGQQGTFYEVRTYPASGPNRLGFHDPRLTLPGVVAGVPGGVEIRCLEKFTRLSPLAGEEEANALLDDAVFETQRPTSTPLALGLADDGRYTYVDIEGDIRRLFMGTPGNMRPVPILTQEGGLTQFSLRTAEGQLDIAIGQKTQMAWNGVALATVDPVAEWRVVFEQLRVYPARTPTPCDLVM
jgi:hypothetical protein